MKEVLVLYNGELDFGVFKHQYESYVAAFENLGVSAHSLPSSHFFTALFDLDDTNFSPDAVIFLDKDIYSAELLESKGFRLFNSADCIRICDDKALTYLNLSGKGLPIPKTVASPKTYSGSPSEDWCLKAANLIGYPLVIKECFGSLGKQVYLSSNQHEMLETVRKIGTKPFVFQEFLPDGAGWDIRVIVAGGEIIGAVKRSNESDFRSNAAIGGKVCPFVLTKDLETLALAAANSVGAFFAGVDIIRGRDGFLVCEVNSNMLFDAAEKALGISISSEIAKRIKNIV